MEVKNYTFQSPYPSQVQFGRPDSSNEQNKESVEGGASLAQESNQTLKSAEVLLAEQTQDVKADVSSSERLLDVYA